MAKYITRTFLTTSIHCVAVSYQNGEIFHEALPDVVVSGKVSDKKANALVSKTYPEQTVIVTGTSVTGELRGITPEDFLAHSVVLNNDDDDTDSEEG